MRKFSLNNGLISQVLSSLTNALMGVWSTRFLGLESLGWFGAAYTLHFFAQGVIRSLSTDRLAASGELIERSADRQSEARRKHARVCAIAAVLPALGLLGIALAGPSDVRWPIGLFAVGSPLLHLHEFTRAFGFAVREYRIPAAADMRRFATIVPLLAAAIAGAPVNLAMVIGVWLLGSLFGTHVDLRNALGLHGRARGLSAIFNSGRAFAADTFFLNGGHALSITAIGVLAGAAELGALRSAQVLLSPLNVAVLAVASMVAPELHRRRDQQRMIVIGSAAALACATLAMWAFIELLPTETGEQLTGPTFGAGAALAIYVTGRALLRSAETPIRPWLRVLGKQRQLAVFSMQLFPITVGAAAIGATLAGASGAMLALIGVDVVRVGGLVIFSRQRGRDTSGIASAAEASTRSTA